MSTHSKSLMRRHLRFARYLPIRYAALSSKRSSLKPLAGRTQSIGAGGLAILLPESVPVSTPLLVQISQGDPLRGNVVWLGQGTSTILGTRVPHGVAFEEPVEAALIRQWVSQSKQRLHARAPVRFEIEYTQGRAIVRGTCLSLSRGGMFIRTRRPAVPGPEILLHFTPPGLSDRLSTLAHVIWVCKEETTPSAITGMGVQFLELEASEAIGSVVDLLCAEAIPPADPSRLLLPPSR